MVRRARNLDEIWPGGRDGEGQQGGATIRGAVVVRRYFDATGIEETEAGIQDVDELAGTVRRGGRGKLQHRAGSRVDPVDIDVAADTAGGEVTAVGESDPNAGAHLGGDPRGRVDAVQDRAAGVARGVHSAAGRVHHQSQDGRVRAGDRRLEGTGPGRGIDPPQAVTAVHRPERPRLVKGQVHDV